MSECYLLDVLPGWEQLRSREVRSSAYRKDPVLWAKEYLGVQLWSKQREILYSIVENRKTAVAAGHGVGKSYMAAIAMSWWIDVHPIGADDSGAPQTFVASTAPFQEQISAILWNNLRIIHALAAKRYAEHVRRRMNGLPLGEYEACDHALPGHITGDNKWKTGDGLLIGQGRKPPDNKADSGYQGLHATYLLAIGDEAAGIGKEMFDALGNITTGPHNRLLLIANPTDPTSEMAQIWKKRLSGWNRMHISVMDSPTVTKEPGFDLEKAKGLSGQDYIDERRDEWGEDDPRYISRVLGQWAFDAGNNLFTDEVLARAANTVVVPDPEALIHFGADIARSGKDHTVVYARRDGEVWETDPETTLPTKRTGRRGQQVRFLAQWSKAPLTSSNPDNPGSAERIHEYALAEGASVILVDASGLGIGVIDGLNELSQGRYTVIEVYGSAASSDARAHLNARSENYFKLRDDMFAGRLDLDPSDEVLFDELRMIVYEYADNGAVKMESKDSMKRRGAKSPDRADALWYAHMDTTPFIDSPLAGVQPGERIAIDPYEMLGDEIADLDGFSSYSHMDAIASTW